MQGRAHVIARILRVLGLYFAFSAVFGAGWLLESYPEHPRAPMAWVILFALAVPVTLIAEFVGHSLFRNPIARGVERRTRGKTISMQRMGYMLCAILGLIAMGILGMVAVFGGGLAIWRRMG